MLIIELAFNLKSTLNQMLIIKVANKCVPLFFGYQTSDCLRPCKTTETRSKLVSKMKLDRLNEMRIRIKFNPTVTVTTTDFVKPSLGVFMSEVRGCSRKLFHHHFSQFFGISGWWGNGPLAWAWYCSGLYWYWFEYVLVLFFFWYLY